MCRFLPAFPVCQCSEVAVAHPVLTLLWGVWICSVHTQLGGDGTAVEVAELVQGFYQRGSELEAVGCRKAEACETLVCSFLCMSIMWFHFCMKK